MKVLKLVVFASLFVFNNSWSQSDDLPFWDYRSTSPFYGKVGINYLFGAQNHGFSAMVKIDYSPMRDGVSHFSKENTFNYYDKQMDFKTGLGFEARRNWKLYNKKPADYRKDVNSWTYLVTINFNVEFLLGKINRNYFTDDARDLKGNVIAYEYSLINQHNTSIFRYLSNTNGRHMLTFKNLTDRFGASLHLQNDFWINILSKHIHNHDHGNTTEFGLSAYWRFDRDFLNTSPIDYFDRKLSLAYWFQIITDRKIGNNTSSAFSRLGYYSVRDNDVFHGYHRFAAAYEGHLSRARIGVLIDDLLDGRNLQRWAHQGTNHRVLKNRKNYGKFVPLKKKKLHFSEFEFVKKNMASRKIFLKQCYYSNLHTDALPPIAEIENLSNAQIKKYYEDIENLEFEFESQIYINKFRFKNSKVMEPTALFPWEGNDAYFRKPQVSLFFDLSLFKQSTIQ